MPSLLGQVATTESSRMEASVRFRSAEYYYRAAVSTGTCGLPHSLGNFRSHQSLFSYLQDLPNKCNDTIKLPAYHQAAPFYHHQHHHLRPPQPPPTCVLKKPGTAGASAASTGTRLSGAGVPGGGRGRIRKCRPSGARICSLCSVHVRTWNTETLLLYCPPTA